MLGPWRKREAAARHRPKGSSASPNLQPWTIGTHIQHRASGGLVGLSDVPREEGIGKRGRRELRDMAAGTPSISPALHSHFIRCTKGTERSRWVSFLRGTHRTKRQAPSRQVASRQGRRENKCSDSFLPPSTLPSSPLVQGVPLHPRRVPRGIGPLCALHIPRGNGAQPVRLPPLSLLLPVGCSGSQTSVLPIRLNQSGHSSVRTSAEIIPRRGWWPRLST